MLSVFSLFKKDTTPETEGKEVKEVEELKGLLLSIMKGGASGNNQELFQKAVEQALSNPRLGELFNKFVLTLSDTGEQFDSFRESFCSPFEGLSKEQLRERFNNIHLKLLQKKLEDIQAKDTKRRAEELLQQPETVLNSSEADVADSGSDKSFEMVDSRPTTPSITSGPSTPVPTRSRRRSSELLVAHQLLALTELGSEPYVITGEPSRPPSQNVSPTGSVEGTIRTLGVSTRPSRAGSIDSNISQPGGGLGGSPVIVPGTVLSLQSEQVKPDTARSDLQEQESQVQVQQTQLQERSESQASGGSDDFIHIQTGSHSSSPILTSNPSPVGVKIESKELGELYAQRVQWTKLQKASVRSRSASMGSDTVDVLSELSLPAGSNPISLSPSLRGHSSSPPDSLPSSPSLRSKTKVVRGNNKLSSFSSSPELRKSLLKRRVSLRTTRYESSELIGKDFSPETSPSPRTIEQQLASPSMSGELKTEVEQQLLQQQLETLAISSQATRSRATSINSEETQTQQVRTASPAGSDEGYVDVSTQLSKEDSSQLTLSAQTDLKTRTESQLTQQDEALESSLEVRSQAASRRGSENYFVVIPDITEASIASPAGSEKSYVDISFPESRRASISSENADTDAQQPSASEDPSGATSPSDIPSTASRSIITSITSAGLPPPLSAPASIEMERSQELNSAESKVSQDSQEKQAETGTPVAVIRTEETELSDRLKTIQEELTVMLSPSVPEEVPPAAPARKPLLPDPLPNNVQALIAYCGSDRAALSALEEAKRRGDQPFTRQHVFLVGDLLGM